MFGDVEVHPTQDDTFAVPLYQSADGEDGGTPRVFFHSAPCRVAARRVAQSARRAEGTASMTNSSPATT